MKQANQPMQLLVSIAQRGDGGALMRQYGSFIWISIFSPPATAPLPPTCWTLWLWHQ